MFEQTLDITTADGAMDTFVAHPGDDRAYPVIFFYMDGLGVRPALHAMARQLAGLGYYVLLPNLYFRNARAADLSLQGDWNRMMELFASIDANKVATSTLALLEHAARDPAAGNTFGSVGYCMGGGYSLAMNGRFSGRFAASACIHGGAVATDAPTSPHRLAPQMHGKLYIAVAEHDPYLTPGETERLQEALDTARADYDLELYAGVEHGFAVPDLMVYNEAAAQRHWQRLQALFADHL